MKLGVEKSRVEMSFNRTVYVYYLYLVTYTVRPSIDTGEMVMLA